MIKIFQQDVLAWCKEYAGEKFHALLCDPPYHLSGGFMGKKWDKDGPEAIAFNPKTWEALAEHLLPGAFGMAFASSRGWHRMACAIEDAGLIIHPTIFAWAFGSGFPKATRIDSQIDKMNGAKREVLGTKTNGVAKSGIATKRPTKNEGIWIKEYEVTKPATVLANAWASHRYGLQALKPALEPIIVFQKPYVGKPLESITKTGAGALNIDGARLGTNNNLNVGAYTGGKRRREEYSPTDSSPGAIQLSRLNRGIGEFVQPQGRWPANFLLVHSPSCNGECVPECPVQRCGEQSGNLQSGQLLTHHKRSGDSNLGTFKIRERTGEKCNWGGDTGTAARFFFNADWNAEVEERLFEADPVRYQAKASRSERDAGVGGVGGVGALRDGGRSGDVKNNHPTVKPIKLTAWLATLLIPPSAYAPRRILIPFSGSGSEMIGARKAGWEEIVGIEQDEEYVKIAEARIEYHCKPKPRHADLFES